MTTRIAIASALLAGLIGAAALLSGCSTHGAPSPTATTNPPAATVATTPVAAETSAGPASYSAKEAWAIVKDKCTVCHTIDRVLKAKLDWKGWNAALNHMTKNGAPLSPAERTAIADYLSSRH